MERHCACVLCVVLVIVLVVLIASIIYVHVSVHETYLGVPVTSNWMLFEQSSDVAGLLKQMNASVHLPAKIVGETLPVNSSSLSDSESKTMALALTCKENVCLFRKLNIFVMSLLASWIFGVITGSCVVLQSCKRWKRLETSLNATLIKQKEAIQQAERKSMNKSLAFASASHDIRASLAGITCLIELSLREVLPGSELGKNLIQMNDCAFKLLGILNSVLDMSKVDVGKMQLEEVEFDLARVLEESTDIFHVVALKKGLEVIWDPCDYSMLKSSNVRGDCRRFKQILDNLLSNAIKFTSEGHVIVRAWARKPCMEKSKCYLDGGCHSSNFFRAVSACFHKRVQGHCALDYPISEEHDPSFIEFVFEVDDTGIGIPKEKRASVFENYVQVKESTVDEHDGTGLGLGIVQSYVRLMGGEISIKEKEPGEKGTCFTFNIFLKKMGEASESIVRGEETDYSQVPIEININDHLEVQVAAFCKDNKFQSTHAIVLAAHSKSREIMHSWLERLGVVVRIVLQAENIFPTHEGIIAATSSPSFQYGEEHKSNFLNDGNNSGDVLPTTTKNLYRMDNHSGPLTSILFIIDISCVKVSELCSILRSCSRNMHNVKYKFVWLSSPDTPAIDLRIVKEGPCDLLLQKPFHGSRLYSILKLLQDNGRTQSPMHELHLEIERSRENEYGECSIDTKIIRPGHSKPLDGISVLLVEDTDVLRRVGSAILSRLGATVEFANNGSEALNLVRVALQETTLPQRESLKAGTSKKSVYDIILMDCEMPIMDGYEATKQIRAEEKYYGLHIPIVALTAHATPDEEKKTMLSGMDFHLTKPLQTSKLVEVVNRLCHR